MPEQKPQDTDTEEIRSVIERVDGELREAEVIRSYINERRTPFYPERRKAPRIPGRTSDPHRHRP
jgi:hypothetical protein